MTKNSLMKEIELAFDRFNKESTDLDFAFCLFADAVHQLEKIRTELTDTSDLWELKKKLIPIEEQLLLAESKFKRNRMRAGQTIAARYLCLISEIKNQL